jgi:hypothetical protein
VHVPKPLDVIFGKLMLDGSLKNERLVPVVRHTGAAFLRSEIRVALLAINTDRSASESLDLAVTAERYTLSAPSLDGRAFN